MPVSSAKVALLWDLDNVCVPRADLDSLATALCGLVKPEAPRIASANWGAFRLARDTLRAHGIRVLCGARDPAGADGVLLQQARRLRKRGVERFVVASNDHAFAHIAKKADVHVVTLTADLVSGRLRAVARSITVLAREGNGWRAEDQASAGRLPDGVDLSGA
ncbi:MAG: hypothetical protein JWP40_3748 [Blastococcus sp.]|nr:hypothetical protein [Blastococcus sp.]